MTRTLSAAEVTARLAKRIDALVVELLPAARREGNEWRVGSPAGERGHSMAIRRSGHKIGVWRDFAGDEGGDALGLVKAVRRCSTVDAMAWARDWLGLEDRSARQTRDMRRPWRTVGRAWWGSR